jgi:hypothetical protein
MQVARVGCEASRLRGDGAHDTRVRVLDLAKIIAQVCCASGRARSGCPRLAFRSRARANIRETSGGVKSVSFRKCFM